MTVFCYSWWDKLSRVTTSQKFIPEIDGLRFFAIFTVVLYHLRTSVLRFGDFDESLLHGDLLFIVLSKAGLGVNVFFTISGFILGLPFLRHFLYATKKLDIGQYFLRRITRLEPPFIIVMTMLFLVQVLLLSSTFEELWPHFIFSLSYVHFFLYGTWSLINPVTWSLETEVQFYIVAPVLALIFLVRNTSLRFVLYGIVVLVHFSFVSNHIPLLTNWHLTKSIVYYFTNFFIGFILADLYLMKLFEHVQKHWLFDLCGLLSMGLLFWSYFKPDWFSTLAFYISVCGLFIAAFKGNLLNRMLTARMLTTIGGMCYTIYLIHYVFLFAALKIFGDLWLGGLGFYGAYFLSFVILIPPLVILSAVFFYFFERPFMYPNWYRRWAIRPKAA